MKKKIVGILVCMLLITTTLNITKAENNQKEDDLIEPVFSDEYGDCAGLIATGSACKGGRSILWKTRHYSGLYDYYVDYIEGTPGVHHAYITIRSDEASNSMCLNEKGLAVASYTGWSPDMSLEFRTEVPSPTWSADFCRAHVMRTYQTVENAANYIANHVKLENNPTGGEGAHTAIISAEHGKGAIVSYDYIGGKTYSHITWVEDDWQAIDNALHCEHQKGSWDSDGDGRMIYKIWNRIEQEGGSSDGTRRVTYEDVCHYGAKNVDFQELLTLPFYTTKNISRASNANSAYVVVSGDPYENARFSMAWVQLGRMALIGTFLPLSVYHTHSNMGIPYEMKRDSQGIGFARYMNDKVNYATKNAGYGDHLYYPERVRNIQRYSNQNEISELFEVYQDLYDRRASESEVKDFFDVSAGLITGYYVEGEIVDPREYIPPVIPDITGPETVNLGVESPMFFQSENHSDWPPEVYVNNQIFFMVDWGDGSDKKWEGPYPPDALIQINHTWTDEGMYSIKAKARGKWGNETDWCEPKEIKVPRNKAHIDISKPININTLFIRFLENHPYLLQLLRQLLQLG